VEGTGQESVVEYLNVSSPQSTGINHKISVILHKGPYDNDNDNDKKELLRVSAV
jgi:hypothetical protein